MDKVHEDMVELATAIADLEQKAENAERQAEEINAHHKQLVSWADIYRNASLDEKRAVAAHIIKAVTLTRDYGIQVEFNISEAQYLSGMDMT